MTGSQRRKLKACGLMQYSSLYVVLLFLGKCRTIKLKFLRLDLTVQCHRPHACSISSILFSFHSLPPPPNSIILASVTTANLSNPSRTKLSSRECILISKWNLANHAIHISFAAFSCSINFSTLCRSHLPIFFYSACVIHTSLLEKLKPHNSFKRLVVRIRTISARTRSQSISLRKSRDSHRPRTVFVALHREYAWRKSTFAQRPQWSTQYLHE